RRQPGQALPGGVAHVLLIGRASLRRGPASDQSARQLAGRLTVAQDDAAGYQRGPKAVRPMIPAPGTSGRVVGDGRHPRRYTLGRGLPDGRIRRKGRTHDAHQLVVGWAGLAPRRVAEVAVMTRPDESLAHGRVSQGARLLLKGKPAHRLPLREGVEREPGSE